MKMNDKYCKVTYESPPIGPAKIILRLTTFDIEAYERDQKLEELPKQENCYSVDISRDFYDQNDMVRCLEQRLNSLIRSEYQKQIEDMKKYIEYLRAIKGLDISKYDVETAAKIHAMELKRAEYELQCSRRLASSFCTTEDLLKVGFGCEIVKTDDGSIFDGRF